MEKTLGIIGGIAPESTIAYYRLLVSLYREKKQDGHYPQIVINSIDMKRMLDMVGSGDLTGLAAYMAGEVSRLAAAGADFGLMASNTPHIVFDEIRRQSRIPVISIVDAACDEADRLGIRRIGLFGTRFTMQGRFYPDVFDRRGITVVVPGPEEQDTIHEKYMGELVNGIFLPGTRDWLLAMADRMREKDGIQGLVLGGTELPLILRDLPDIGIPFLDTTRIHVEKALSFLAS